MLAKANLRSSSETPIVWSKRATAFRTWLASVIGSLRCFGKANTLSGKSLRPISSPCFSCGFQVASISNLHGRLVWTHPRRQGNGSSAAGFPHATLFRGPEQAPQKILRLGVDARSLAFARAAHAQKQRPWPFAEKACR